MNTNGNTTNGTNSQSSPTNARHNSAMNQDLFHRPLSKNGGAAAGLTPVVGAAEVFIWQAISTAQPSFGEKNFCLRREITLKVPP